MNRQVTPSRTVQQQQQPQQQPPVSSQALAAPPPPTSNGTTAPSLEVGDNVLVNGIKPGVVAFLGPTQFARGTWAGVVLDSPEGKNNGSVNGVQYFVCEANRGLFSKPEKLTFVSKIQSKPPLPPSSAQASNASEAAFEVGDRVLTDSGKSGVVGFVGTTQFAKGVWAGVILDTTEGKNSGSVNGVQYFECEANHGIFTRLQKLKLVPKAGPPDEQWHPPPTGKLPPSSRGSSQATSSRGASQERGGPPLASIDLKALKEKLKLGDRVLVGGAKEGFLRYLGPTEFAKGVWAGVELEDAQGKNDGAVSGKRYFQCAPRHGLFAPLPKVEKLASAADDDSISTPKSSTTSITPPPSHSAHSSPLTKHRASQPPLPTATAVVMGTRRFSESSTSSLGSARHAQEPPPPMVVSSLAGTTAGGLSRLLQEKERSVSSLETSLKETAGERDLLQEELTELKRKLEDLQFQMEEQGIIIGDQLETATESSAQQVSRLTRQLKDEREDKQRLLEQLAEVQPGGGGEAEEGMVVELESEVARLQGRLEERGREADAHLDTIAQLKLDMSSAESAKSTALQQVRDIEVKLASSEESLQGFRSELHSVQASSTELGQQLGSSEEMCRLLTQQKFQLDEQLSHMSELSGDSSQQVSYLTEQLKERDRVIAEERMKAKSLESELGQSDKAAGGLQADLTATGQELQQALDLCSQHEELLEERNQELCSLEAKNRSLSSEKEQWSEERQRLKSEQERLAAERDKVIAESDRLLAQSASASSETSQLAQQRRELLAERDSLLAEDQALQTEHAKILREKDELMRALSELELGKQQAIGHTQEMSLKFDSTQNELTQALSQVEQLRFDLATSEDKFEQEKLSLSEELELEKASGQELHQRASEASDEREATLQQAQEMADRLDRADTDRDRLQLDLENSQIQLDELQFQYDELNTRHIAFEHECNAETLVLAQRLDQTECLLSDKDRELAEHRERNALLSEELVIAQKQHDQALLEEEKQLLEERVEELTIQLERAGRGSVSVVAENGTDKDFDLLTERLQEAQSQQLEAQARQEEMQGTLEEFHQQVDFLNSVIADLQRKLETAEALAGLHGPVGDNQYGGEEYDDDQLPPPRLFCDICDVFDQHDTDDCPLQAASDSPPPSMHHGRRALGGSDRPYCDNCEVFGHGTDECEYDATY